MARSLDSIEGSAVIINIKENKNGQSLKEGK